MQIMANKINSSLYNTFLNTVLIIIILSMLSNNILDNRLIKITIYCIEITLIFRLIIIDILKHDKQFKIEQSLALFIILISTTFILSKHNPDYSIIIKYLAYIYAYKFGVITAYNQSSLDKHTPVYKLLILIPLLAVALFDHSSLRNIFFSQSNSFSYWGIAVALLYYVSFNNKNNCIKIFRISLIIIISYSVIGTSFSIIVGLTLAWIYIKRNDPRIYLKIIAGIILLSLLVYYSRIPLFIRIKDLITFFTLYHKEIFNGEIFAEMHFINNLNIFESERHDITSSTWRFMYWIDCFREYIRNMPMALFGMGNNYFVSKYAYQLHNEFMRILYENGIIPFLIFFHWTKLFWEKIKSTDYAFFFIIVLFIWLTHNPSEQLPPNLIIFYCFGYIYNQKKIFVNQTHLHKSLRHTIIV